MTSDLSIALIALTGTIVGAALGAGGTYVTTRIATRSDREIAKERLEAENRLSNAVLETVRALLLSPKWDLRSFDEIKRHIRGFDDNELRHYLLMAGAVSFDHKGSGKELWGLRDRNARRLEGIGP